VEFDVRCNVKYNVKCGVQSMKVPRLRAMCEARGLKKNGTKQQLITRLLASTADSLDAIPGWYTHT